jgi:heptosyltransferase-2
MENTLIIKTGAAGDVVRTTSLLNVLDGNIYWVVSEGNAALLPDDIPHLITLSPGEAFDATKDISFDRVISLEEDRDCARLAATVNTKELVGIYLNKGLIDYTASSSYWFDMSKESKLGMEKANQLKAENFLSYQECIFRMIGKTFNGEPYRIFDSNSEKVTGEMIGIEKRSGERWPDKQWWGYDRLIEKLEKDGHAVKVFEHRNNIRDYLNDIATCTHIVSGDTLAMHVALAYKKRCTAIFNCTSPQEIYDYGLLKKLVSPFLYKYFYSSSLHKESIESISVEEVYRTLTFF